MAFPPDLERTVATLVERCRNIDDSMEPLALLCRSLKRLGLDEAQPVHRTVRFAFYSRESPEDIYLPLDHPEEHVVGAVVVEDKVFTLQHGLVTWDSWLERIFSAIDPPAQAQRWSGGYYEFPRPVGLALDAVDPRRIDTVTAGLPRLDALRLEPGSTAWWAHRIAEAVVAETPLFPWKGHQPASFAIALRQAGLRCVATHGATNVITAAHTRWVSPDSLSSSSTLAMSLQFNPPHGVVLPLVFSSSGQENRWMAARPAHAFEAQTRQEHDGWSSYMVMNDAQEAALERISAVIAQAHRALAPPAPSRSGPRF